MVKVAKKVGIIGYGYVGKAMARFFERRYDVIVYDPAECLKLGLACATQSDIDECDLAVVCVPTPTKPNGEADLSAVEQAILRIKTPRVLLKSTVPVGTTDRLSAKIKRPIVFSPEYLGESAYWTPHRFHEEVVESTYFIFGGERQATKEIVDFYLPVAGPTKSYHQTDARTAEMTKYMENTYFATKITYCYEVAEICAAMGLDFHEVRELWLLDPRINPMHTGVFADNAAPFSGKCLPKDLSALIDFAKKAGYQPELLKAVEQSNERIGKIRKQRLAQESAPTKKRGASK